MTTATARKSGKKSRKIKAEHSVYGPCLVIERRATATGNDILLAEFPDKSQRILLAAPQFWKTATADLKAIPRRAGTRDRGAVIDDVEPEFSCMKEA